MAGPSGAVTKWYNDTPHSATAAPPNAMSDSQIFSQRKKATENLETNMKGLEQRETRLKKAGGFRTQITKKTGLKRRVDEATYSSDIKVVKDFPAPGYVEDTQGVRYRTSPTRFLQTATSRASKAETHRHLEAIRGSTTEVTGSGENPWASAEFAQGAEEWNHRCTQDVVPILHRVR